MIMDYDYHRIKVWEDLIVNEDFVNDTVRRFKHGIIPEIYFKIDEGPPLEQIKYKGESFIKWLQKQNLPSEKIKIESDNLVQDKTVWQNYIPYYNEQPFLYGQNIQFTINKQPTHKFGMFIGGYRWPRLYFASHMYCNHYKECLMSYNHKHLNIDALEQIIGKDDSILSEVEKFSNHIPILIDRPSDDFINFDDAYGICDQYNKIKIDLVFETWWQGQTFMPTEKTARPILTGTPFIVFGPKNYLKNLRRLGFKTFDGLIDESYDAYEGLKRLEIMKQMINTVDINLQHAQNILLHNQEVYKKISKQSFIEEFGCQ